MFRVSIVFSCLHLVVDCHFVEDWEINYEPEIVHYCYGQVIQCSTFKISHKEICEWRHNEGKAAYIIEMLLSHAICLAHSPCIVFESWRIWFWASNEVFDLQVSTLLVWIHSISLWSVFIGSMHVFLCASYFHNHMFIRWCAPCCILEHYVVPQWSHSVSAMLFQRWLPLFVMVVELCFFNLSFSIPLSFSLFLPFSVLFLVSCCSPSFYGGGEKNISSRTPLNMSDMHAIWLIILHVALGRRYSDKFTIVLRSFPQLVWTCITLSIYICIYIQTGCCLD